MTLSGFFGRLLRGRPPSDTAALDQLVVKQLRGLGADLSQKRHVRHFLYFEDEPDARRAADEIERADYLATVRPPTDEVSVWTVVGEADRVIAPETVAGFRAWFEQLAAEHRGEYDGWEPATKP